MVFLTVIYLVFAEILVVRIDHPEPELIHEFIEQDYDIASYRPGIYLDLVIDETVLPILRQRFPQIRIHDSETAMKRNLSSPDRPLNGYRSYSDVMDEISDLATAHPGLLRTVDLGISWGKYYAQMGYTNYNNYQHDIVAVMLSDNADVDEDEPAFYFVGAHHAREPISTEVVMTILHDLVENYGTDPEITEMVDSSEIWFIPIINPDGHKIVIDQTFTSWRKNIRDNNDNQIINLNPSVDGVDLNRNYGHEWGYMSATDDMESYTYHGLGPFTELEIIAFRDFLPQRQFLAGISYHSYGELVLHPYGYMSGIYAPDSQELAALGTAMANSIVVGGHTYTPSPAWQLYPASGSTDDYVYGNHGIFGYTIELATQFIPSASMVPVITAANIPAAKILLNRKNHSALTGKVLDAVSGEPINAYVHVVGLDDSPVYRAPYRANENFGSYWRLLSPGDYTVRYYLHGYEEQERVVTITADSVTVEDVELNPSDMIDLLIMLRDNFGSPISGTCIDFLNTDLPSICFSPEGTIFIPDFSTGTYRIRILKEGFEPLDLFVPIYSEVLSLRMQAIPTFFDGFEGMPGAWTYTNGWGICPSQAHTGTKSSSDNPNGNNYQSVATARCDFPVDLTNATSASVQFWVKHSNPLTNGYIYFEVSGDDITTTAIDYYSGTSDWVCKTYSLNAYLGKVINFKFGRTVGSFPSQSLFYFDDFRIFVNSGSSVPNEDETSPHAGINISAYPNPFKNEIKIHLSSAPDQGLLKDAMLNSTQVRIYNVRGQLVKDITSKELTAEAPFLKWDGKDHNGQDVRSGVYFVKVQTNGIDGTVKKILKLGA